MSLEVEAVHRQGAFRLDVSFSTGRGLIALCGRSGSGKTTLVNIVAGLVRPERGRVVVEGRALLDTERRIELAPHAREIGYVFQEGRLFPHLSVRSNLLYGARLRGLRDRDAELRRVCELLGIGHLLPRRPSSLSGGEKQRVAIGRALLARPRLLLMDEPLASLDEPRKQEILPYLERLRDELRIPILYVSHSIPEVTRLATTLVLLVDGRIAAQGPLTELMSRPGLRWATGRRGAGVVIEASIAAEPPRAGLVALSTPLGGLVVPEGALGRSARPRLHIQARDVLVGIERPRGLSARNVLPAFVRAVHTGEPGQAEVELAVGEGTLFARLTLNAVEELGLVPGRPVFAVVKSVALAGQDTGEGEAI